MQMDERSYGEGLIKGYEEGMRAAYQELLSMNTAYSPKEFRIVAKTKLDSIDQKVLKRRFELENELGVSLAEHTERLRQSGINIQQFEPGKTYTLRSNGLGRSLDVYTSLDELKISILAVMRENPYQLRERTALQDDVIWISTNECRNSGDYPICAPSDLGRLTAAIQAFIDRVDNGIVFIEGVDYLVLNNDMIKVRRFLNRVKDLISQSSSCMLIHMDPYQMEPHIVDRLGREMGQVL